MSKGISVRRALLGEGHLWAGDLVEGHFGQGSLTGQGISG